MPKLILDDATIGRLVETISGFPIHAGPNGDLLEPGVQDVLEQRSGSSAWQPADERTRLLVLGTEACREVTNIARGFHEQASRARIIKNLAIPVCSLMEVTAKLQKTFNDEDSKLAQSKWPSVDINAFVSRGKRIRKLHLHGPARLIRNKLGAHLDADIFDLPELNVVPAPILEALGDSLIVFALCFNHEARAFSWIRHVGAVKDQPEVVVDSMFDYPACVRWLTDPNGKVLKLLQVIGAADPRQSLQPDTLKAFDAYNFLVQATGCELPLLTTRNIDDVLAEEGRPPMARSDFSEVLIGRRLGGSGNAGS